ncbi:hypothetical protein LTR37_006435 [Vermiconidia calcicola]|uniref:Uncharacterized protein n=1 Tax=Vermiconidia calcicola TaxID=1690605 RepID=A0ACC3NHV7_9PEZI|nr:hypothetical protein LTR37_006435 [Vermiconidia calcicola]
MATSSNFQTGVATAGHTSDETEALKPNSHTLEELQQRALESFDRDAAQWTDTQKGAWQKVRSFFNTLCEAGEPSSIVTPTCGTWIIEQIGKLFFLDGLSDIEFAWRHEHHEENRNAIATTATTFERDGRRRIIINVFTAHSRWQSASDSPRWLQLWESLLHESLHAYFSRFSLVGSEVHGCGHHTAWQLVAEAVERRSMLHLNVRPYLSRARSMIIRYRALGRMELTQEELTSCFGEFFEYRQDQDGQWSTFIRFNARGVISGTPSIEGYIHDPAVQESILNLDLRQSRQFEISVVRKGATQIFGGMSADELSLVLSITHAPTIDSGADIKKFWELLIRGFHL